MILIAALMLSWQDAAPDPDCVSQANLLRIAERPARQGATLAMRPMRYSDMSERPLAEKCIAGWEISDPRAVSLSPDHRSVIIAPDAVPGTVVTVAYLAAGKRQSVTLRIVGRDEPVLTGIWSQTGLAWCSGKPLGELKFSADGNFMATVHPFETYVDHSGTYQWDAVTERLTLNVTSRGRNDTVRGLAKIDPQGVLHIKGISFEDMTEGKDCQHLFK